MHTFKIITLPILLTLLLSWTPSAMACSLCSAFDGVVFPRFHFQVEGDELRQIEVTWQFSPSFTDVLRHLSSESADPERMRTQLLEAFEADIVPYEYLTTLTVNGTPHEVTHVVHSHFTFEGEVSSYHFTIGINQPVGEVVDVELEFFDPRRFLGFFFRPDGLSYDVPTHYGLEHNLNSYPHTLVLSMGPAVASVTETVVGEPHQVASSQGWYGSFMQGFSNTLRQAGETLRGHLKVIKEEGSVVAALSLIGFSFVYGILHAAGPGHGKSLVASYFLSGHHHYTKAASMALLIGVVHVFSAFSFTFVVLTLLNIFITTAIDQTSTLLTLISGAIILAIALHLAYTRLRARWRARSASNEYPQPHHGLHQQEAHACGCSSCSGGGRTSDAMLVISAGIVPCPGTITIFLFALSMGMYTIGFLAAAAMSLGMGIIIFAAAALSILAKNVLSHSFQPLATVVEYASIALIAALGGLLILSSL